MFSDLIITGDFCPFDFGLAARLGIGNNLFNLMSSGTYRMVNLECPLTTSSKPIEKKGPALKGAPEAISLLKKLNITHCNLANNHIKDFGVSGIIDTVSNLTGHGIDHFGLQGNQGNEHVIVEINHFKVAFLSFTENEFSTDLKGGAGAVGMDYSKQYQQIESLKKSVDHIIVQYHGGVEMYHYPTPQQQKYCRFLVDAGASLVICHHSHCISGFETYNGKTIYYGLGNFYFPETDNVDDWYSGLVLGIGISDQVTSEVHFVQYDKIRYRIDIDSSDNQTAIVEKLNQVISNLTLLNNQWNEYCIKHCKQTLKMIFKPGIFFRMALKAGLGSKLLVKKADASILNLLKCESHFARLLNTIEILNSLRKK